MIVSTTNEVPGAETAEVLGIARGNTIRARHIGRDVLAGLKGAARAFFIARHLHHTPQPTLCVLPSE